MGRTQRTSTGGPSPGGKARGKGRRNFSARGNLSVDALADKPYKDDFEEITKVSALRVEDVDNKLIQLLDFHSQNGTIGAVCSHLKESVKDLQRDRVKNWHAYIYCLVRRFDEDALKAMKAKETELKGQRVQMKAEASGDAAQGSNTCVGWEHGDELSAVSIDNARRTLKAQERAFAAKAWRDALRLYKASVAEGKVPELQMMRSIDSGDIHRDYCVSSAESCDDTQQINSEGIALAAPITRAERRLCERAFCANAVIAAKKAFKAAMVVTEADSSKTKFDVPRVEQCALIAVEGGRVADSGDACTSLDAVGVGDGAAVPSTWPIGTLDELDSKRLLRQGATLYSLDGAFALQGSDKSRQCSGIRVRVRKLAHAGHDHILEDIADDLAHSSRHRVHGEAHDPRARKIRFALAPSAFSSTLPPSLADLLQDKTMPSLEDCSIHPSSGIAHAIRKHHRNKRAVHEGFSSHNEMVERRQALQR